MLCGGRSVLFSGRESEWEWGYWLPVLMLPVAGYHRISLFLTCGERIGVSLKRSSCDVAPALQMSWGAVMGPSVDREAESIDALLLPLLFWERSHGFSFKDQQLLTFDFPLSPPFCFGSWDTSNCSATDRFVFIDVSQGPQSVLGLVSLVGWLTNT